MIRLFIEDQELDVNEGFTHQITYAVDDINNIDSKATAFSKTIILPGTSNNNKLLGNIFEFGNSNTTIDSSPNIGYNFNASKSANIVVEINGLIILKGAMRLLEIVIDGEMIEYEVALFGELGGFVAKLGNKRLQDLDFSIYNHTYDANNIKDSWEESETFGAFCGFSNKKITITYTNKNLIQGEIIDVSGTTYNDGSYTVVSSKSEWDNNVQFYVTTIIVEENLINEPTATANFTRTKRGFGYFYPLIDYGKVSTNKLDFYYKTFRPAIYVRDYVNRIIKDSGYTYKSDFFNTNFFKRLVIGNNQNALSFKANRIFSGSPNGITILNGGIIIPTQVLGNFSTTDSITFKYTSATTFTGYINVHLTGTYRLPNAYIIGNCSGRINLYKNGSLYREGLMPGLFSPNTPAVIGGIGSPSASEPFDITIKFGDLNNVVLSTNDEFKIQLDFYDGNPLDGLELNVNGASVTVDSLYPIYTPTILNDLIQISDTVPQNILQKNFFASILKMFNLMVTEDKYKRNHLIIEPWVDFYNLNRDSYIDWSDKLDRSEPIRIKPMSEVNARYYEFKYKSDSDYYNEKYRKKYNEGYGDRKFDNNLEFAKETSSSEVIFSATPLVGYSGQDKIVSTIFKWDGTTVDKEEQISSNIRILQVKKITDVAEWDILDKDPNDTSSPAPAPITNGSNLTVYGYAGHLDDPDAPNSDINFGATNELYFELATGALSNNMFNAYYSSYMAEITDKDSRLFTGKFKLNEKDIFNLDFGRFIYVDGVLYRLIKVYDYSEGELSKVDLLRVIYTTY